MSFSPVRILILSFAAMFVISMALVSPATAKTTTESAKDFSFLFVGGFGNELGRSHYFAENIFAVRQMGATLVEAYFPPSLQSVEKNTERLRAQILDLYKRGGGRPIVILGHSKGGLETLATLLRYPELVRDGIVAQAILIQAPLGGNRLIDERGRWGQFLVRLFSLAPGFRSIRSEGIHHSVMDRLTSLAEVNADYRRVSRVVSYVVTEKPASDSARVFRMQSLLPRTLFPAHVPNDGLIATADMAIPGFGSVLSRLTADHLETVLGRNVPILIDNVDSEAIRSFTKNMVTTALKKRRSRLVLSSTCESLFLTIAN